MYIILTLQNTAAVRAATREMDSCVGRSGIILDLILVIHIRAGGYRLRQFLSDIWWDQQDLHMANIEL